MNIEAVKNEVRAWSPAERRKLIRYLVALDEQEISGTRLSPKQLRHLADRIVASKDPAEIARLKAELERGFYGDPAHA